VDSKKIEAIEVVYRRFFKSLIGMRKTTNTSIVLTKFGKFPFEHFAWGQALLYYNRVSTVTKDRMLRKAWEAQLAMLVAGKKCWAGSVKKWLLKNQPHEMIGFLSPIQEHLLLVCPNKQKVTEQFCLALPLTHINTFVELMQITNIVTLAKFMACYQYQRTICPP